MMLSEQAQKWFPTHVQVTVLQAKDLKPKGKSGTNDTYTIIQLGKEKYSTSVAEKTLEPVWKEEASFELPGLLMQGNPEKYILFLIVMHRSLVGLDKFLGQVAINLNDIFEDKQRRKTEWFRLESKQGKRAKNRGEIKVNIQFMRNNMTASMFDLSMKDKTRSPFAKLKDKMKGRKNDGTFSDTSSAIIPSSHIPDANTDFSSGEIQMKSKPKKPFLLGPQRLSSAHSMSDLTGTHISSEKLKSAGTIGQTHLLGRHVDSFGVVPESGSLKSPHRRTLSFDTSKMNQPDSSVDEGESSFGRQNDPFTNVTASLPQKFATLPRKKNPFEESSESWDSSMNLFSKSVEVRKENKREKREKVSLFERVTGKKDSRRSDKLNNGGSDSPCDLKSPNAFSENRQDYFDYESTNPFTTKFRASNIMPSSSFHMNPTSNEDLRKIPDSNPFDATAGYRGLTYEEVLQELVKHKELLRRKDTHIRELEDYIDNLLVRVMEETPSILRVPYEPSRKAGKFANS
ncbi:rab11 family-interacting protein 2 isoform 1-T1 [Lycaon pictus]|uniref:Rab11 family-interacting protein 2 n=2 Tax=Canis lupus familiaris TaxID=9615 RepID=A0A8C0PIX5_CANLF|nr:rab11 family-interacting protein 2 isoform X2 [Canis lupus dingo]XP_038296648.1 rab11 family-interacting protein 2 isoform X2 [Canis lupus familiaris]XP_038434855.1 rab11 family-interacting protein 2 isoform X2 [Canis lupus familiaris]XP_535026.3 rab11 family-interacting protein 2 isoform X2 [Canis lupus familiaris]|eukprot:XP_535026.3 rab11 family-interacting protein 2 isoform X2 [Canis lupus familiaris]